MEGLCPTAIGNDEIATIFSVNMCAMQRNRSSTSMGHFRLVSVVRQKAIGKDKPTFLISLKMYTKSLCGRRVGKPIRFLSIVLLTAKRGYSLGGQKMNLQSVPRLPRLQHFLDQEKRLLFPIGRVVKAKQEPR